MSAPRGGLLLGGVSAPSKMCLLLGGLHGGTCLGCVSAPRGVSAPGGVSGPRGVCLLWGHLLPGGMSAPRVGVCLAVAAPGGMSAPGGVSAPRGVCLLWAHLLPGGMSAPRVGVCLAVAAPGGMSALGGLSAPERVVSQHALRQTSPPSLWTDRRCKNITFATSLRTVKTQIKHLRPAIQWASR